MSHTSPPLSSEAMSILEQSLLKVPVEAMRKNVRVAARSSDKELTLIETALKKTRTTGSREDKLRAVENAINRMKQLKRKVRERGRWNLGGDRARANSGGPSRWSVQGQSGGLRME